MERPNIPATTSQPAYGHPGASESGKWLGLAHKYAVTPEDVQDLLQEARIAEWQAGQSYDPAKRVTRKTWEYEHVRGAMAHYRRDRGHTIRPAANRYERGEVDLLVPIGLDSPQAMREGYTVDFDGLVMVGVILAMFNPRNRQALRLVADGYTTWAAYASLGCRARALPPVARRKARRRLETFGVIA